jgi:hypothetical protein
MKQAGRSQARVPMMSFFFQFTLSFQSQYGAYSTSSRNEYQHIFVMGKARLTCKAENFTDINEPLPRKCGILDISQPIGLQGLLQG